VDHPSASGNRAVTDILAQAAAGTTRGAKKNTPTLWLAV